MIWKGLKSEVDSLPLTAIWIWIIWSLKHLDNSYKGICYLMLFIACGIALQKIVEFFFTKRR